MLSAAVAKFNVGKPARATGQDRPKSARDKAPAAKDKASRISAAPASQGSAALDIDEDLDGWEDF